MTETPENDGKTKKGSNARSAARLGAVQALYQLRVDKDTNPKKVVSEFLNHRLGQEVEGDQYNDADSDFFKDIVIGANERLGEVDDAIRGALSEKWSLERLELLVLSILRAGTYELMVRVDVPTKVIINEYVDVAHAFFARSEPGFINGVLDRISKSLRE